MDIVNVVMYGKDGRPQPARCQLGLVRMPDSGDVRIAAAIVGREIFVVPPYSALQVIGVLRDGLQQM